MLADRAVGVFRSGDQTFYKHVGDVIVGNIVLKLVSDNGVVIEKGKQLFTLEIGHSDLNPTTRLSAPALTTMNKSAALINKAAIAYHATEAASSDPGARSVEMHTQMPLKLQSASSPAPGAPSHTAQTTSAIASNPIFVKPVAEPVHDSDKIVVSNANLVATPGLVGFRTRGWTIT